MANLATLGLSKCLGVARGSMLALRTVLIPSSVTALWLEYTSEMGQAICIISGFHLHKMVTAVNVHINESEMPYQDEDLVSPLPPDCTGDLFPMALHHPPQPLAPQAPQQLFLQFHSDSNMFEILNAYSTVSKKSREEVYQTLHNMAKKASDSLQ